MNCAAPRSAIQIFPYFDAATERQAIHAVADARAAPVPKVLWVENDSTVLDAALMPFVSENINLGTRLLGKLLDEF